MKFIKLNKFDKSRDLAWQGENFAAASKTFSVNEKGVSSRNSYLMTNTEKEEFKALEKQMKQSEKKKIFKTDPSSIRITTQTVDSIYIVEN